MVDFISETENISVAGLIEKAIPCTTTETFILNKHYKVVEAPRTTHGKWPDPLGNAFFIDSNYLFMDLVDMVKEKLFACFKSHRTEESFY